MYVVTLKPHRYKGKQKFKGDKYDFEGTRSERRLALAIGWVKEVEKPSVKKEEKKAVVHVKEVNVDPVVDSVVHVSDEVVEEKPEKIVIDAVLLEKPKRTYKRRDLVSDE